MIKQSISTALTIGLLAIGFTGCGEEESSTDNNIESSTEKSVESNVENDTETFSKSLIKFHGTSARDYANAGDYDSSNNFYAVGQTKGDFDTAQNSDTFDMYLSKFDESGNVLCTFQYGTDHDDVGVDVVVDSSDNVYVTGWTHKDFDSHTYIGGSKYVDGGDIFVMKFNSSCEKQSSILFGSTDTDTPTGMSIDSEDNIYLTGWTNDTINSQVSKSDEGKKDYFITKLNTDLTEIWTTQDGSNGNDWTNDIDVDSIGNLYVVGSLDNDIEGETSVQGNEDGFIAKYNTGDGSRIWARSFGSTNDSGGNDAAHSVSITSTGSAVVGFDFVADGSGAALFGTDGVKIWQKNGTNGDTHVVVDENDNIYLGVEYRTDNTHLYKFDKDGEEIWDYTAKFSDGTWISDLFYNNGYVYALGATDGSYVGDGSADNTPNGDYDALIVKFK
jgi:hypothetical protein